MDFWSSALAQLPGIVVGALTIALGALIVWVVSRLWQRARGGEAQFYWMRLREGDWFLQRRKRRTAFDVAVGDGITTTGGGEEQLRAVASWAIGDMPRGRTFQVAVDGQNAWVSWVEGNRRRHSVAVSLSPDKTEIPVVESKARGQEITTAY